MKRIYLLLTGLVLVMGIGATTASANNDGNGPPVAVVNYYVDCTILPVSVDATQTGHDPISLPIDWYLARYIVEQKGGRFEAGQLLYQGHFIASIDESVNLPGATPHTVTTSPCTAVPGEERGGPSLGAVCVKDPSKRKDGGGTYADVTPDQANGIDPDAEDAVFSIVLGNAVPAFYSDGNGTTCDNPATKYGQKDTGQLVTKDGTPDPNNDLKGRWFSGHNSVYKRFA